MRLRRARPLDAAPAAAVQAGTRYRDLALYVGGALGLRPGDRRFPGHPQPTGVEVERWQAYAAGDDLRHLDWAALGRLDALLVRRFTAEREVVVHLLVDTSASMRVRWPVATELALALAAIGLQSGHAARLVLLRAGAPPWVSPLHRRASSLAAIANVLDDARPDGAVELGPELGAWARRRPERAAALLVSDLLVEPPGLAPGVQALRRRTAALALLQVLGPTELAPEQALQSGLLVDAETGGAHAIVLDADTLRRHRALLAAHTAALAALAADAHAAYARLEAPVSVDAFVRDDLARIGLVRPRGR